MNEHGESTKHDVIIKSREKTEMTGILDVTSFDDGSIIVQTADSGISIDGENLKIEKFDAESGDFILNGKINGFYYFTSSAQKKKKSIMSIFK